MNYTAQSILPELRPRKILTVLLGLSFAFAQLDLPLAAAAAEKRPPQDPILKGLPITELNSNEAILHALNRLAYGPRPGDVDRVRQMGLAKWIEQQLNPNLIDDRAAEARLENYPTLRMSTSKLLAEYPQPKQAQKEALSAQREPRRSDAAAAVIAK